MAKQDRAKKWAEIVAKAWIDEKFKQKLMDNPKEVLEDMGLELPSGMSLKVLEDTQNQHFLILPEKPKGNLSEMELKKIAAGTCAPVPACTALCAKS